MDTVWTHGLKFTHFCPIWCSRTFIITYPTQSQYLFAKEPGLLRSDSTSVGFCSNRFGLSTGNTPAISHHFGPVKLGNLLVPITVRPGLLTRKRDRKPLVLHNDICRANRDGRHVLDSTGNDKV